MTFRKVLRRSILVYESHFNLFSPELLVSFPFTPPLCNCVYELTESVSEEGSCPFHFEHAHVYISTKWFCRISDGINFVEFLCGTSPKIRQNFSLKFHKMNSTKWFCGISECLIEFISENLNRHILLSKKLFHLLGRNSPPFLIGWWHASRTLRELPWPIRSFDIWGEWTKEMNMK